jgi:hypothetical protein
MAMSEDEAKTLVGLTLEEARQRAAAKGSTIRVCSRDGVSFPGTADLRPERVDVHVENDKVTAAFIG